MPNSTGPYMNLFYYSIWLKPKMALANIDVWLIWFEVKDLGTADMSICALYVAQTSPGNLMLIPPDQVT